MKHLALLSVILLGGCTSSGTLQGLGPVCEALGDPIKYNPTNKNSPVHAGPQLATRLDQQDQVGENLNCPAYK